MGEATQAMDGDRTIIIIGGGFSGAALAIQLAARGIPSTIVEARGQVARGAAYSTRDDEHLLNVPAGKMSLWPGRPHDFAEHVEEDGLGPQDFVSRRRFGEYVAAELARAATVGCVRVVRDRAVSARPDGEGWSVTLANGDRLDGAGLVLANGNQPPSPVPVDGLADERRIDNPWSPEGRAAIARLAQSGAPLLLLGTGLTMVDVALTLDRADYAGRATALSRRGQLPRAHVAQALTPLPTPIDEVPASLAAMVGWLRARAEKADDWRAAIDGMRPVTQAIWQRLSVSEQSRFLRHLRPWWDVHRHRIAPQAAAVVEAMVGDGRLEIVAGRAVRAIEADGLARIEVARRGGGTGVVEAAAVINCTGPLASLAKADDPLLQQMLGDELVMVDELGIGVKVDEGDRLAGLQRAWGIGPVTKGKHWEITAVPDIRLQAERIAGDIAANLAVTV
ncbi:FAD/NAD(P)-binding protein [Sphingomonas jaspsi]|uniref:FAD/NAD(P)-binding protein n=1 Tax=Sphingomonas jaspsi TaxID=392409 RepID=UPI0004B39B73|nr:FAD/NAD(P)-binding protein [Sphingomonas jaspsi]